MIRERFFTPRLRFASYDELNAWLADRCVAHARAHRHPEIAKATVWSDRAKDVDYLTVAVMAAGQAPPDGLDRGRQAPVLERRSRGVKNRSRTSPTWFSTCPFSQPDAGLQATGSTR